ncbi:MAG: pyrimidine-nucleoside phosphorylase [Bacilli bacterium]|nr:pyrimidine-nucleoside phosphorylase [Bacilli bacterium]MBR0194083.1 pyrimidine-nucleoside phosphorylase [Bacilli bacterium]MBR0301582.1 pyrimidine-nucleoside phosphorylase [Bacilli bacterium]
MRMVDIITKKRDGGELTDQEITFFVNGYVEGKIPDYQVSALLMAIIFKGMTNREIVTLTDRMEHSGDVMDLSSIKGVKVDKHSTGGVGDKTTLALGPMVAACGAILAKMSGRGLGHTGGTLDKLESIPGMNVFVSDEQFRKQVSEIGCAVVGQTGQLVPADKKLYALRDVTGTVESMPLIASSVMSKKLASGSDCILLDVKFGNGAFMKNVEAAKELATVMCKIGNALGRDTRAVLTDMEQPLGFAVGNALEVKEAIATLHGHGPKDFTELCLRSGAIMLEQAKIAKTEEEAMEMLKKVIADGSAFEKFRQMVIAQGGDVSYIDHPEKFPESKYVVEVKAPKDGYIKRIVALEIGESAMRLGAGRETFDDVIDMSAGIVLSKKVGDKVKKGDVLCTVHTNVEDHAQILKDIEDAFHIVDEFVAVPPTVHDYIR